MTTYFPGILSNGALVPGLAAATVRNTLGLGTGDNVAFARVFLPNNGEGLLLGASNTHLTRRSNHIGNLIVIGERINLQVPAMSGNNGFVIASSSSGLSMFESHLSGIVFGHSARIALFSAANGVLEQRNATNAQKLRVAKTWTSATSFEQFEIDTTQTGFIDLVALRGSAGGAENGIRIGAKLDDGSIVPWLSFATTGEATFNGEVAFKASAGIQIGASGGSNNFIQLRENRSQWGEYGVGYLAASDATILYGYATRNVSIGHMSFNRTTYTPRLVFNGSGLATFSGTVNFRAGTATAGTAPIKLTTGVNLTTPEAGAIEYDGTNLYFTDSGGTRRTLAVV